MDTSEEGNVLVKIEAELNIVESNTTIDPDKYLPDVLETFALLYFCPPQHLVEAVKLGIFYENLHENENLRTVAMATLNNIMPDNQFENRECLIKIFNAIDKEYNLQLGPALIALSSASQLKQLAGLDLPYVNDYKYLINKCVNDHDCSELENLVHSSGEILFFIFCKINV